MSKGLVKKGRHRIGGERNRTHLRVSTPCCLDPELGYGEGNDPPIVKEEFYFFGPEKEKEEGGGTE